MQIRYASDCLTSSTREDSVDLMNVSKHAARQAPSPTKPSHIHLCALCVLCGFPNCPTPPIITPQWKYRRARPVTPFPIPAPYSHSSALAQSAKLRARRLEHADRSPTACFLKPQMRYASDCLISWMLFGFIEDTPECLYWRFLIQQE